MPRRRPLLLASLGLLTAGSLASGLLPGATAGSTPEVSAHKLRPLEGTNGNSFPGAEVAIGDADRRGPRLSPHATVRAALAGLTKQRGELKVSWTQYGTPLSITKDAGWLAEGLQGSPAVAARAFLKKNAALWGLTPQDVDALELWVDEALPESKAHGVLFRQRAAGLPFAEDGLISVGIRDGAVAIVTSSAVPSWLQSMGPRTPKLSVKDAVLAAAKDAGVTTLTAEKLTVSAKRNQAGFQVIKAEGLAQHQLARLRVLPTTDKGLRLVWETDVIDVADGRALATASYVDASTGKVLLRRDAVDTLGEDTHEHEGQRSININGVTVGTTGTTPAGTNNITLSRPGGDAPAGGAFSGKFEVDKCGASHEIAVPAGAQTLVVTAAAAITTNDIVIDVKRNGKKIAGIDTLFSPEAGSTVIDPPAKAGDKFEVLVCPYDTSSIDPRDYAGTWTTLDQAVGTDSLPPLPNGLTPGHNALAPATWRAWASNPVLGEDGKVSPDDRDLVCSGAPKQTTTKNISKCDFLYHDTSPFAYDVEATTGLPTFSTIGNNAVTTDARYSSALTPGAPVLPPVSPTRDYSGTFTDVWHRSGCSPLEPANPVGNDIYASIVNLFVGHNRTHDFAYTLGLTEPRGALQVNNFGKGGAEGDPELGNAQNAAATHVVVSRSGVLTGRDNANQITLQDGVPGVTNQYLWQPIVGFYSPCADGDLDGMVFIHEYGHAITNRLVAGPDTGLSGSQSGAMGESWGDLMATEYLNSMGLAGLRGEDPFAMGAYATGDKFRGIRNYNQRTNPLNYSEYGYDATGPQVHADGEIWTGVQSRVRAALIAKYRKQFNDKDKKLQKACTLGRTADGKKHSTFDKCPGNRRWVQYMYDSMILMANGSPTMVDMKDAMLAADMLRTKGKDQTVMATAFASKGLGKGSSAVSAEDSDPVASYVAPVASENATITFKIIDAKTKRALKGDVRVGYYQARTNAVASTRGGEDDPKPTQKFGKGKYQLLITAPGYGFKRTVMTFKAGEKSTRTIAMDRNLAASVNGATAKGDFLAPSRALDEDEGTNTGFDGVTPDPGQNLQQNDQSIVGKQVTIDLAGSKPQTVSRIAVSALHHPTPAAESEDPIYFQHRFIGLRAFDVQASSDGGKTFKTVYKSPSDFFPADAPRPVAPDLILRFANFSKPVKATHLRLIVRSNACTGTPDFVGEKENDPVVPSDCTGSIHASRVVFSDFHAYATKG